MTAESKKTCHAIVVRAAMPTNSPVTPGKFALPSICPASFRRQIPLVRESAFTRPFTEINKQLLCNFGAIDFCACVGRVKSVGTQKALGFL